MSACRAGQSMVVWGCAEYFLRSRWADSQARLQENQRGINRVCVPVPATLWWKMIVISFEVSVVE